MGIVYAKRRKGGTKRPPRGSRRSSAQNRIGGAGRPCYNPVALALSQPASGNDGFASFAGLYYAEHATGSVREPGLAPRPGAADPRPAPRRMAGAAAAGRGTAGRSAQRAWLGLLALAFLVGAGVFVWAVFWFRPPQSARLVLVGAGYETNLAVPTNVYGRDSLPPWQPGPVTVRIPSPGAPAFSSFRTSRPNCAPTRPGTADWTAPASAR